MKRITPTLLGTLLLAGSASAALAAGADNSAATGNQLSQSQQPQEQSPPVQNKPNTTEGMWSQDLAAGTGQAGTIPASAIRDAVSKRPKRNARHAATCRAERRRGADRQPPGGRPPFRPLIVSRRAIRPAIGWTDALNILGSDGYVNIQSLTPQGDQFLATATLDGRDVSVLVDPQTRQVTNRS